MANNAISIAAIAIIVATPRSAPMPTIKLMKIPAAIDAMMPVSRLMALVCMLCALKTSGYCYPLVVLVFLMEYHFVDGFNNALKTLRLTQSTTLS